MAVKVRLGDSTNLLRECGYSLEEEAEIYDEVLQDVYNDPRWYLDNIESIECFRVRWKDYRTTHPVMPYKYVIKEDL